MKDNRSQVALVLLVTAMLAGCGGGSSPASTVDRTPDEMSFTSGNIASAVPGFVYESPTVMVKSIDAGETLAANVEGGEISVNGGSYKAGPVQVALDDALQLRAVAPVAFAKSKIVKLTLGAAAAANWTIATPESTLQMAVAPKRLDFSWSAMTGAERFELHVNPDGASGFVDTGLEIGADAVATSTIDLPVHLTDWNNAVYQLQACRSETCVTLPGHEVALEQAHSMAATNYVKAEVDPAGYASGLRHFGSQMVLSSDGNMLAVGQSTPAALGQAAGGVHVYRVIAGQLELDGVLYPDALGADAAFGSALAMNAAGNKLVIGAPRETVGGNLRAGAIYIFSRGTGGWVRDARIEDTATAAADREFGQLVAISADGSKIGAVRDVTVEMYKQEGANWTSWGELVAGTRLLSFRLSGDGRIAYAGAISSALLEYSLRVGEVEWTTTSWTFRFMHPDDNEPSDDFGADFAFSADGSLLVVGARKHDSSSAATPGDNDLNNSGTVFVYRRTVADGWEELDIFKSPRPVAGGLFGHAVEMNADGSLIAVSEHVEPGVSQGVDPAFAPNPDPLTGMGAVHLFKRSGDDWIPWRYVKASNAGSNDNDLFGFSLALSADGKRLVVGAPMEKSDSNGINPDGQEDDSRNDAPGAAYIY